MCSVRLLVFSINFRYPNGMKMRGILNGKKTNKEDRKTHREPSMCSVGLLVFLINFQ